MGPGRERAAPRRRPDRGATRERRVKTGKSTKRRVAALLLLEALSCCSSRGRSPGPSTGLGTAKTLVLVALAVVLVVAGAMLRRSWGIGLGSFLQLLVLATGFWTGAMFVLGAIFLAIWLYVLNLRHQLVGTPGGWRLLVS